MEPLHLQLLHQLYFEAFDMQKLLLYIEESQIGDHFDYYCFNKVKKKDLSDLITLLYNNNETFRNFVNKKDKRTVIFFTQHYIPDVFNNLFTTEDFEKYSSDFALYACKRVQHQDPITRPLFETFKSKLHKIFKDNWYNYYNYFKSCKDILTDKEMDKIIKYFINNANKDIIDLLLQEDIQEKYKKTLRNELFIKEITPI